MPHLPKIEVHNPELHLPELPDLPAAVRTLEWPTIDVSSVDIGDLGKTVAGLATSAHLRSRPRRLYWPLAVTALVVAGLTGWIAFRQKAARDAMARTAGAVRAWVSTARLRQSANAHDPARVDPVAFTAARTAAISSPSLDGSTPDGSGYPAGLGTDRPADSAQVGLSRNKEGHKVVEKSQHVVALEASEQGSQA